LNIQQQAAAGRTQQTVHLSSSLQLKFHLQNPKPVRHVSTCCRCIAIILLKSLFEHTAAGRRWSAKKQQQQLQTVLSERLSQLDASVHSLPGISHCTSLHGAAAQEVEGSVRALAAGAAMSFSLHLSNR
jgi:branched-subunit amino acid ABC-type transport system permease component